MPESDLERPPELKVVPGDQLLIVGKNNMGVFVYFNGAPVARNPLLWRACQHELDIAIRTFLTDVKVTSNTHTHT